MQWVLCEDTKKIWRKKIKIRSVVVSIAIWTRRCRRDSVLVFNIVGVVVVVVVLIVVFCINVVAVVILLVRCKTGGFVGVKKRFDTIIVTMSRIRYKHVYVCLC